MTKGCDSKPAMGIKRILNLLEITDFLFMGYSCAIVAIHPTVCCAANQDHPLEMNETKSDMWNYTYHIQITLIPTE